MSNSMSRRVFITGLGALAAAGALSGCTPRVMTKREIAEQEGATVPSWLKKPEIPGEVSESVDADLVVVGAGNGGLVAAVTAAQEGAKVVVLESGSGIAVAREAIGALNSSLAGEHQEDVPTLLNHASLTQSGDVNMLLYRTWAEKSGEMIEWMAKTLEPKGMLFPFEWHRPDDPHAYYPAMCYNPVQGEYNPSGPNYSAYMHLQMLAEVFEELGGEIRFLTPAEQLSVSDDGSVTGVYAVKPDGTYLLVNANKGVILCTGGYAANQEMLDDLCPGVADWCVTSSATSEKGQGIKMALWAGAELEPGGGCMIWNRGGMTDETTFGAPYNGEIFLPGSQPFLHVNIHGERFMNEDQCYPMSYAMASQQPGHYSWMIFDSGYWDDIVRFDTCGCSRIAPAPAGTAFNADVYSLEACGRENLEAFWIEPALESGVLKKADTLEELAQAIGFDEESSERFVRTVERYNSIAETGIDVDFGKPAYRLSGVTDGPFFAARMGGTLLVSTHGIITDVKSRALRSDGSAIPGLYVCGNDQGGFYPHNYPSNFTGINAGRTATFARIAAKDALGVE